MNTKVSEDFDLFNPSKKPVPQTSSSNTFSMTSQSVEASSFKQPNEYSLTFKIPYKTELGQSLCVVGSIGQLGNWKDFKAHLKWTEGHVWVLPNVSISSSNCVFQYKYVVLDGGKAGRWEQGFNRIADLKLLSQKQGGGSNVELQDEWDRYFVNFTMYFPLKQNEYMKINGDPPELGFW